MPFWQVAHDPPVILGEARKINGTIETPGHQQSPQMASPCLNAASLLDYVYLELLLQEGPIGVPLFMCVKVTFSGQRLNMPHIMDPFRQFRLHINCV